MANWLAAPAVILVLVFGAAAHAQGAATDLLQEPQPDETPGTDDSCQETDYRCSFPPDVGGGGGGFQQQVPRDALDVMDVGPRDLERGASELSRDRIQERTTPFLRY